MAKIELDITDGADPSNVVIAISDSAAPVVPAAPTVPIAPVDPRPILEEVVAPPEPATLVVIEAFVLTGSACVISSPDFIPVRETIVDALVIVASSNVTVSVIAFEVLAMPSPIGTSLQVSPTQDSTVLVTTWV